MRIKKYLMRICMLLSMLITMTVCTNVVYAAASFSVSGGGTVEAGSTSTITITTTECGGEFSISVSGGGSISGDAIYNDNIIFVDGTSTFTVKAPSSGSTKVTVTALDVVDLYKGYVTGSKSVTVKVKEEVVEEEKEEEVEKEEVATTPDTTTTTTPTVTESSNSNLVALSIDEGEIDSEFYYATTSYTVTVYDVDSVTVNATQEHSAATILSGTGEQAVVPGENELKVVVEAENGYTKTYTIIVTVIESPKVYFTYNDVELAAVYIDENIVAPDGFEMLTMTIDGEEVTVFNSNLLGMVLLYLEDADGNGNYYIYNEETGELADFITYGILGKNIYIVDILEDEQARDGMVYGLVTVDGNEIMGWTFEDEALSDYVVIYVMNDMGQMVSYLYCISDNSMIIAPDMAPVSAATYTELLSSNAELTTDVSEITTERDTMYEQLQMAIGAAALLAALLLVMIIVLIIVIVRGKKKYKKLEAISGDLNEDLKIMVNDFDEDFEDDFDEDFEDDFEDDFDKELDEIADEYEGVDEIADEYEDLGTLDDVSEDADELKEDDDLEISLEESESVDVESVRTEYEVFDA